MEVMQVNGKSLVVETHGTGEAIVMVHGLGGSCNVWLPQREVLSQHFRVVCLDLDGAGRSPCHGELSIESLVEDVLALMDRLEIEAAHLVGHSMGTIVCQHLAAGHAGRVKSMALLGPLTEPPAQARSALRDRARLAREEGMAPIANALLEASISRDSRMHQAVVCAFVREVLMAQPAEGYARTCEALANAQSARLAAIECPSLLITGSEDQVGSPADTSAMARGIANSRLLVLANTGHWTGIERPGEVNNALLNFYFDDHVG